jgi:hypothetical protein
MSKLVFGRSYEIIFEDIDPLAKDVAITTISSSSGELGEEALQISGNVTQSLKGAGSSPSKMLNIQIVNLPKDLAAQLEAASMLRIKLRLGYDYVGGELRDKDKRVSQVFVGEVKDFKTSANGVNFITSINAVEGTTEKAGGTVTSTFRKGTKLSVVLEELAKSFNDIYIAKEGSVKYTFDRGVAVTLNLGDLEEETIRNDRTFEGETRKELDDVCSEFSLTWLLSENVVYIHKKNLKASKKSFLQTTLEPEFVVGSINKSFNSTGKTKKDDTSRGEITITTFMNPEISPDITYKIPTSFDREGAINVTVSGLYKPTSWEHAFNYRGALWNTKMILNLVSEDDK